MTILTTAKKLLKSIGAAKNQHLIYVSKRKKRLCERESTYNAWKYGQAEKASSDNSHTTLYGKSCSSI